MIYYCRVYPFLHTKNRGYWIDFPEFPGCFAEGCDLEEALKDAKKSLEDMLNRYLDYKDKIPKPVDYSKYFGFYPIVVDEVLEKKILTRKKSVVSRND